MMKLVNMNLNLKKAGKNTTVAFKSLTRDVLLAVLMDYVESIYLRDI